MMAWWDGGMGILTPRHPVAWLEPKDRDEDDEPKAKKEGLSLWLDGTEIIMNHRTEQLRNINEYQYQ